MRHLWSVATWEIEQDLDSSDDSMIAVPVSILDLDVIKRKRQPWQAAPVYKIPLAKNLYLLTAWYVHDFLDKLHISFTDPKGRELWYNEPRPSEWGISTKAVHVIPMADLWYTVDGLYKFTLHFSNDDGRRSESGSFRIVLNSNERGYNV